MSASAGARTLFWALMAVSLAVNFIIFKDLADISQWLVQSSRDFTMWVWYQRHVLAAVGMGALVLTWVLWLRSRSLCGRGLLITLSVVSVFLFYSGYINPHVMFRAQQYEAKFVPVSEARPYLEKSLDWAKFGWEKHASVDDISMIVLETDEGPIAYSDYFLLQPHVVKGAEIDGEEVIMTYCGLTNMGIAYSPVIDDQPLDLSVMTQLENNLVMWDHNTGEPIQQIWGTMEGAPERGKMKEWPTVRMPFSSFEELFPDGRVFINLIPDFSESPLVAAWDRLTRHVMMYNGVSLQWVGDEPAFPTIHEFDERLPRKALIWGLNVGDDFVAYTKDFVIENGGVINTRIGDRDVVVAYDSEYDSLAAWYNDTGAPVARVDMSGSLEDGQALARVETLKSEVFWFIWANFNKTTDVNRA